MSYIIRAGSIAPFSPTILEKEPINIQQTAVELGNSIQVVTSLNAPIWSIANNGAISSQQGIGLFGATPPGQPSIGPPCTSNVTSIVTLVNNIRSALLASGLVKA